MAQRAALLVRMLLSLVLIVAAMPLRASAPPCPPSLPSKALAKCAMPCCAKARVEMPCCKAKKAVANQADACPCELKAAFPAPAVESKAVLPAFGGPLLLLPEAILSFVPTALVQSEPGVFGTDSGPPISPPTDSDASRAPPVARA